MTDNSLLPCTDHWKKTIPVLAKSHKSIFNWCHCLWILSSKPCEFGDKSFCTFETWATQLYDSCVDVVKDEAFFLCNSIGVIIFLMFWLCRWILWFFLVIFSKCLLLILVIYACLSVLLDVIATQFLFVENKCLSKNYMDCHFS
jgi:hypothetical protein